MAEQEQGQAPKFTMEVGGRDMTSPWVDRFFRSVMGRWAENPDKTLDENSSNGIALYGKMLRLDNQISLCLNKRASNVLKLGYEVHPAADENGEVLPAAEEHAEFIKSALKDVRDFQTSRRQWFQGILMGYKPSEIIFKPTPAGKWGIKQFKSRDPSRFRFAEDDTLIYVGKSQSDAEPMPGWKFVLNTWGSDETPYGEGLMRTLYPLWYFKANAIKSFMRYVEKFGLPHALGKAPEGAGDVERNVMFEALQKLLSGHVGVVPFGAEVELVSGNNQNAVALIKFLVDEYVDRQYAKAILGQTLSTESESGTHALAKYHSLGEQALVEDDALWQMSQMQPLVDFLVEINFGPQEQYPKWVIPYEDNKDLMAIGQGLRAVVDIGVPVTKGHALEMCGLPQPAETDPEELLKVERPLSPFDGLMGGGGTADGGDEEANGLSGSAAGRAELASKKKLSRREIAAQRVEILNGMAADFRDRGHKVYAKWIQKQARAIAAARSLHEINEIWNPEIDVGLARHYEDVFRTAEMTGKALYYREAFDQGLEAYAEGKGPVKVPASVLGLDKAGAVVPKGPMPAGDAWKFFKKKVPMEYSEYKKLNGAWKAKGFAIARLENERLASEVKNEIERSLREGGTLEGFLKKAKTILTEADKKHLETVYLTNVQSALSGARWQELQRDGELLREFFPYLQYVTAGDDAVRESHAALDGLILRRDDPLWQRIYPPNGYNCRCMVVEVNAMDADAERIRPASGLPLDFSGPDPGFESAPVAA